MKFSQRHIIFFLIAQLWIIGEISAQSGSFGNTYSHNEGEIAIFGHHDFEKGSGGVLPGMVGTHRDMYTLPYGLVSFAEASSGWSGADDDSYIDGYVKKYGNRPFVFPIGDNGKYRPLAVRGNGTVTASYYKVDASIAITSDLFGGNFAVLPMDGPYASNQKANVIVDVSDIEYWDVDGSQPTTISLSWDIFSEIDNLTNNDIQSLSIIGWRNGRWEVIPSEVDFLYFDTRKSNPTFNAGLSSFIKGSITSLVDVIPDDYSIITFGATVAGTVGDLVWEDMNRNGIQEVGEPGIANMKVDLFTFGTDSLIATTQTNEIGRYAFANLPEGTYYMQFYPEDGLAPTLPFQGASISRNSDLTFQSTIGPFTLDINERRIDLDGGYYRTGSIGDLVWLDSNQDGIQSPDENGVPSVRVELYKEGEDGLLASTVTSEDGIYRFTNLPPDVYYIKVIPPDEHAFGPYKATLDETLDSDIIPLTGLSDPFELVSGQIVDDIDAALSSPCTFNVDYDIVAPECGVNDGSIDLFVDGLIGLYTFEWNTGDSTSFISNIDTGNYTVIVRNEVGCTRAIRLRVDYDQPCALICAEVNTQVFLEGTYNYDAERMNKRLNELGYLPGQKPTTFLGTYTEPGHPYNDTPWFMGTDQGMTFESNSVAENNDHYPDDIVDWVLVSVRAQEDVEYEICTRPALLHQNGEITYVDDDCCLVDPTKEYYVVVEHRNHLIVMSPTPMPVENGEISFDFRNNQSYIRLLGNGQKEVAPGVFAMYAANGEQYLSGASAVDINVNDLAEWLEQNGNHSSYYRHDFDLNGDANVQDKGMYLKNIGIFTDVPKD